MSTIRIPSRAGLLPLLALWLLVGCLVALSAPAAAQTPTPTITRPNGTLTDGTPWQIAVPSNWNGTLLVDLDFDTSQARYPPLYVRGFAGAGIRRSGASSNPGEDAARFPPVIYQSEKFARPFFIDDVYAPLGCANPSSPNAANGYNRASPETCPRR